MSKQEQKEQGILGYIELESGLKPVKSMNDIYLNFTYNKPENWETLRQKANIFYEEYISRVDNTKIQPIIGNIKVSTQYEYLLNPDNLTRRQDFKVTTEEEIESDEFVEIHDKAYNYIEFNNTAPEALRGIEYFGLGIGHSGGKPAHQLWLASKGTNKIFEKGEAFAEYVIKHKTSNRELENNSTMLFVNLKLLSKEQCKAGELANILLDLEKKPQSQEVLNILDVMNKSFKKFKTDKGAKYRMTVAERYTSRAKEEGKEEGKEEILEKLQPIIDKQQAMIDKQQASIEKQQSSMINTAYKIITKNRLKNRDFGEKELINDFGIEKEIAEKAVRLFENELSKRLGDKRSNLEPTR